MVMNLICFPLKKNNFNTKPISTEIKFYFMLSIGVLLSDLINKLHTIIP